MPQVVAWASGLLSEIVGHSLRHPRVTLAIEDVHDMIVAGNALDDVILLGVADGPDGLIHLANERLSCDRALRAAHAALPNGGILAVWSAYSDEALGDRLHKAAFAIEVNTLHVGGPSADPPRVIWLAVKQSGG